VIRRQALRFAAAGAVGLVVDAGVLLAGRSLLGWDLYSSRALSYVAAVTVTWALNRAFTFKEYASSSKLVEWARFFAANTVGGAVNLGVYAALVNFVPRVHELPVLGVAAGSLSGLCVNFTLARTYVFRTGAPPAAEIPP
jgi:putative flippase GtrA